MANRIDPYTQRFPTNTPLLNQNGQMSKEWVDWFNYDNLWKQQIYLNLDAGSALDNTDLGFISNVTQDIIDTFVQPAQPIRDSKSTDVTAYTITSNHTTAGDEDIMCNNTTPITITLNATPDDDEELVISRRDAKVTISGTINGKSSLILGGRYSTANLRYKSELAEWVIE